jgi:hypothetical protein
VLPAWSACGHRKKLGLPERVSPKVENAIREQQSVGNGILKVTAIVGTVQRVTREMTIGATATLDVLPLLDQMRWPTVTR